MLLLFLFVSAGPLGLVSDWSLKVANRLPPSVCQMLLQHILNEPFILKINQGCWATQCGLYWWRIMGNKQGGFRSVLIQVLIQVLGLI